MEVITVQSEVWKNLKEQIEVIQQKNEEQIRNQWENEWIDNDTLLKRLGISRKTAQAYRDNGLISFSQVGNKIYYRNGDVEEFLMNHRIKRREV